MSVKPARILLAALFVGTGVAAGLCFAKDRNALSTIVHDKCVPDEVQNKNPAPCMLVDLAGGEAQGYVILKDIRGATQFLLIPTRKISGIESPDLLQSEGPNYFADAWNNRHFVEERAGHKLAWDKIGLAVNSARARSQDQLHIHIDCVRPDVREILAMHKAEIGTTWTELSFDLAGKRYLARRLAAGDLAKEDPFKLLAEGVHGAHEYMANESLALVGVAFAAADGFVLLASLPEAAMAHNEDLLDHACAVAAMP